MRILRYLVLASGVLVALGLATGYMGALHPIGDSLAVIRPGLAVAMVLLALAALGLGAWRLGALGLGAAMLAGVPVLAEATLDPALPRAPVSLTLYTKNLWAGTSDTAPVLADIRDADPDLVFLQEVSQGNIGLLSALSGPYPHQHLCRFSSWSGIAILSRWPLDRTACSDQRTLAVARVAAPSGPIWAVAVHLVWPYPHAQARYLDRAMPLLDRVEGRAVVAGDFNMVPWGHSVARIAGATGAGRIGRVMGTFDLAGIPLPIDHVLTTGTGSVERRGTLGSDHYGLLARIAF